MKIAQLPQIRRKKNVILIVLILALPLLVFATHKIIDMRSRASQDIDPKNVAISDITTSLITISWTTEKSAYGSVVLLENGEERKAYKDVRDSSRLDKRYTHYVELSDLAPNTQYKFLIQSDSKKYTSSEGKELMFRTAPMSEKLPVVNPAGGQVSSASDDDVVVYLLLSDQSSFPVSSTLSSSKSWHLDLSSILSIADKERVKITDSTGITILAIDGRGRGAVLTGTYATLFDSAGILRAGNDLLLEEGKDIYASLPKESKLVVSSPEEGKCWYFDGICKETTENCSGSGRYLTRELCISANTEEPSDPYDDYEDPYRPDDPYIPGDNYDTDPMDNDKEFTNRQYRIIHHIRWTDLTTASQSGVSGSTGPDSIKVTNLSDTKFTVLWVSAQKEEGTVKYGTSPTQLNSVALDKRDGELVKGEYYVHTVNVEKLQPETKYYYNVVSGNDTYSNGGKGFTVTTFPEIERTGGLFNIVGELTGMPEHKEVILLASIKDGDDTGSKGTSTLISTDVSEDGSWGLPLSEMRVEDGTSYFEHTAGDTLIIEPYTTFSAPQEKIGMEGIDLKDIVIGLEKDSSVPPADKVNVGRLKDYGIVGSAQYVVPSSNPQSVSPETPQQPIYSGETPKTGALDSFWGILLISISLIGSGTIAYFSFKKKGKGDMVKEL
ncbi:fibronectin type III domain-containing protein [Candidatus Dojkabacteria bacterium]|nr:fibronectin type III domain-containing protein [Candidatus Dojkabacteria bacterium]